MQPGYRWLNLDRIETRTAAAAANDEDEKFY